MESNPTIGHWYAYIYEQQENQTYDAEFLLSVLGDPPLNILEACCGGGRIAVPLAEVGHKVTGFDIDEYALERLAIRAKGFNNLKFYRADAVAQDWGNGFDVVVMAGNLLINIESDMDYRLSQRLFISKASNALLTGGLLYLDFDCFQNPETSRNNGERVIFEGMDDLGTYGRYVLYDGEFDGPSRISKARKCIEITDVNGVKHNVEWQSVKYFPDLCEVENWLAEAGFVIERVYGGHDGSPRTENSTRAIILARKR